MKRGVIIGGGLLLLGVAAAWAWDRLGASRNGEEVPAIIDADDAEQVALGRVIYSEQCASCHGEALEGEADWRGRRANGRLPAPPHDASGHTWHHTDEVLFRLTKYGPAALAGGHYESDMPAYEEILSDREICAISCSRLELLRTLVACISCR